MYTIRFENNKLRDNVKKGLEKAKVMSKIYFEPVHLKTFYREKFNYTNEDLLKTQEISKKVLTLPLYPTLTYEEIHYILDIIKKYCE